VLLSASVDFDSFKEQVEIAFKTGVSDFSAGRPLWQEGAQIHSGMIELIFLESACSKVEETSWGS
jgi:tagatose-1,6-bisphosphate aldolase